MYCFFFRGNRLSKYKDIISKSCQISSGCPVVYQLKPKKQKCGALTRVTIGENKTILLLGEPGAGKSTLVNALVNYAMGVTWEDKIWFQFVEDEPKSQTQTSDVIVYEIIGYEGKTLPFSLTIINTPGYDDDMVAEHYDMVSQRLLDLFRSEDGPKEVHAVGLVMKASQNRITYRTRNFWRLVLKVFPKDVGKITVLLITCSNGGTPENVLCGLEDLNIKYAKDQWNEPVHFLFDNCQMEDQTKNKRRYLEYSYRISESGMSEFTAFLEKMKDGLQL